MRLGTKIKLGILGLASIFYVACTNPAGGTTKPDEPKPIEITISGLESIVNDRYVDTTSVKNTLDFDVSVVNGNVGDVYWGQEGSYGNGNYSDGTFTFSNYPDSGLYDMLVDGYNSEGDIESVNVSGLLHGPERSYFIGNSSQFNSEFGSLDGALESAFGGAIGASGEYLVSDINSMFDGFSFKNYLSSCQDFRVGKNSSDDSYVIGIDSDEHIMFEITSGEYDLINSRDPYNGL